MSLSYTKLVGRDASFQLIRTNPKLTSNVKLTVDSKNDLWLNSIPADPELAKDQYQRVAVDTGKSHEFNIFKFYNNGKTPSKLAYRIGTTIIQTVSAKDLKDQYEFDYYTSGAKYLESKQYTEKFSYFAPIYLNQVLPDTFVIFKIKGASDYPAGFQLTNDILRQDSALEFFKNFQLVKAFDMSPESKIGRYLETILENPMRPQAPIGVNFNSSTTAYSYYRGLSIKSGTYVELPVNTNSIFTRGLPLLTKEKFVVSGFEDNSILHPNIINLEFLFDDDTAKDFEINRYFGFYCNRIELAQFDADLESMFLNPNDNDQALEILRNLADDISIPVTNTDGVRLRGTNLTADVSDLNSSLSSQDSIFFSYLETKSDIHLIKPGSWSQTNNSVDFRIDDSSLNIGTLFGPGELYSQEKAVVSDIDSKSTLCARIDSNPENASLLKVYHPTGSQFDSAGHYDAIYFIDSAAAVAGSFVFNEPATWLVDYSAAGQATIYVSADGSPRDIAFALAGAINDLKDSSIQAVPHLNYAFIQLKESGESFGILKAIDTTQRITLIGTQIDGYFYADGGTLTSHPIINSGAEIVSELPLQRISDDRTNLLVKTDKNWSRISRVARSTDNIFPDQTETGLINATSRFLSSGILILEDNETPLTSNGNLEIRRISKNRVGVFSIFELKDFDFDIYSTQYSRFETLDLFKDFFEPVGIETLRFREHTYLVIGKGVVLVNGIEYQDGDYVWQDQTEPASYRVIQGDCVLIKSTYSPNALLQLGQSVNIVDAPLTNGDLAIIPAIDDELSSYTGQFSLRTPAVDLSPSVSSAKYTNIAEYRDKFINGAVNSEYLIHLEQHAIEFTIDNKLTPYICKWGLKDSIDARSNPYRLNTDLIFGKDNFGPSHVEIFPSAEKLTHEWFYVESDFGFTKNLELLLRNFNYFESEFNVDLFKTQASYFDQYFQYVPTINNVQVDRVQLRYSDLFRDPYTGQFETVFRGVKYRFFELDSARIQINPDRVQEAILSTTDRFLDYRFSAILKVVNDDFDDNLPPVKYEIIENTDSKSIVAVIYLRLAGDDQLPTRSKFIDTDTGLPTYFEREDLLEITPSFTSIFYEDVYGDYRIKFNEAEVSNLTYSFLYYAKNKKYNIGDGSFSTIRLATNVDLSFAGFTQLPASSVATGIDIDASEGYMSTLASQISIVPDAYSPLAYKNTSDKRYIISEIESSISETTTSILNVVENTVEFSSPIIYLNEVLVQQIVPFDGVSIQLPTGSPELWKENHRLYQINGGKDYYERIFQYFSFANFKYLLENFEDTFTWTTYSNGQPSSIRTFTMRVQDANAVNLTTAIENQAVLVTYNSKTVTGGYVYGETPLQIPIEIHRYSGEYDAIFKPVSAFYQKTKIGQYEIVGANCSIHIGVKDSFLIPELNHIKYSTSRILDLENSANYSAEYPVINETPIGTAPFNVLSSSWDKGYHFEYLNKSDRVPIFGTRRLTEDYSFVSKLVKTPDTLFLSDYTIGEVTQPQFRSTAFTNMLDFATYKGNVRFKFDLETVFAKNFSAAGLKAEFEKFFISDSGVINQNTDLLGELTLSQYVEAYAKLNLQRLYKVEEIQIWTKLDKTIPVSQVLFEKKTLDELVNEGYSQSKSVQINNQNSSVLEGAIDRPINSGIRVSFRIKIKFI